MKSLSKFTVSISGADSNVKPGDLIELAKRFPFVRWGILWSRKKAGSQRYPTTQWMQALLEAGQEVGLQADIHVCDKAFFDSLVANSFELTRADPQIMEIFGDRTLQLNINARSMDYSDHEVLSIYRSLGSRYKLILQQHEGTKEAIDQLLQDPQIELENISVLQDASRGKGIAAQMWERPLQVGNQALATGFAGGVSPENIDEMLDRLQSALMGSGCADAWIDMESGVRTENEFDLEKVEHILQTVSLRLPDLLKVTQRKSAP